MYKKSFYGYGKESVQEAISELEKKYGLELKEVDDEIEDALNEYKSLHDQLKRMIAEYKRLRENTRQMKQLKEYMPYIVTQKKQNIDKDIIEARKSAQEYIHNVNQHCLIIDGEIEKVKHKIEMFADSLSQIFVLQDVREFDDGLRHFDQMLDECLPQKNKTESAVDLSLGLSLDHEEAEDFESIEELIARDFDSLEDGVGLADKFDAGNKQNAGLAGEEPEIAQDEEIPSAEERETLLEKTSLPKIAASAANAERNIKKEKNAVHNSSIFRCRRMK
jgi:hypothetical protein